MPEFDLLSIRRGAITAPAGCGKTQLIADCLAGHPGHKPVLILTHTNAGRTALEARLAKGKVPKVAYRVATIDSWSIRLISNFPKRSGHDPAIEMLNNPSSDYANIRRAARTLLRSGDISDALRATYSNLLVDEYQDCTIVQHNIIDWAATALPTCVLGDPLQAIFGFDEPTVDWAANVHKRFPPVGELARPWRWTNAGTERLGTWLLHARQLLLANQMVDLRTAPEEVVWEPVPDDAGQAHKVRQKAAGAKADAKDGTVLIIGDSKSPQGQRLMASQTFGATTVEAVDLKDLTKFGAQFDVSDAKALERLLSFAADLMTGVGGSELLRRVHVLDRGTSRTEASPTEKAALDFLRAPSFTTAQAVLYALEDGPTTRVYRPEALRVLQSACASAALGHCTFKEAVAQARERNRHLGRPTIRRAVGSTLLLKGLEADTAVVLCPEEMDARHLYVALTRGARKLVVCSKTPVLGPRA